MVGINLFGAAKANADAKKEEGSKERLRDWQRRLRGEVRDIDRGVRKIEQEEAKIKKDIQTAAKREELDNVRVLAKSLARSRKATSRLYTARSHLVAVQSELECTAATMRLSDAMKGSAEVMRNMNAVVNVPELQQALSSMQREMFKAGLVEEMMDEAVDDLDGPDMEEEAETAVDSVLQELAIDENIRAAVRVPKADFVVPAVATGMVDKSEKVAAASAS